MDPTVSGELHLAHKTEAWEKEHDLLKVTWVSDRLGASIRVPGSHPSSLMHQWQCWLRSCFTQQGDHSTVVFSQGPLLRWLKVNFSEAFVAWIHVKALRVFVESVLRWVNTGRDTWGIQNVQLSSWCSSFVEGTLTHLVLSCLRCVPYTLQSRSSQETIQIWVWWKTNLWGHLQSRGKQTQFSWLLASKIKCFPIRKCWHHQRACLDAEEGKEHEQRAVPLPSRWSRMLCS